MLELSSSAVNIRTTSANNPESGAKVAWLSVTNALSDFEYRQASFAEKLFCPLHSRASHELERGFSGCLFKQAGKVKRAQTGSSRDRTQIKRFA
jgi:hypothetical protein